MLATSELDWCKSPRAGIASGRQTEPVAIRQPSSGRGIAIALGVWIAVVVGGIVLASLGEVLREPLCVGGGSECAGAKAPAQGIGDALFYLGTGMTLASPLVVASGLALRRMRATSD
jgi:hypothetical protein